MFDIKENAIVEKYSEQPLRNLQAGEVVLGTLCSIDDEGRPRVNYPGSDPSQPVVAISALPLTQQQIRRQVALLFVDGDYRSPMIIGLIHSPLQALLENYNGTPLAHAHEPEVESKNNDQDALGTTAYVDGERVLISARKEVVLKCGEASITLTQAGKILIRGKYVLSRSSGINRIQGCSVQVN